MAENERFYLYLMSDEDLKETIKDAIVPLEGYKDYVSSIYLEMGSSLYKKGEFDNAKNCHDKSRDHMSIYRIIVSEFYAPLLTALSACETQEMLDGMFDHELQKCEKGFWVYLFDEHLPKMLHSKKVCDLIASMIEHQRALKMPYSEYLKTDQWKAKRKAALERAGFRCQNCHRKATPKNTLNVHHRVYVRLGAEYPTDLTVLCHDCHTLFHKNRKVAKRWE